MSKILVETGHNPMARLRVKMDDPIGSLDIVTETLQDCILVLFLCKKSVYTDAVKLPINNITTALADQLTTSDIFLGTLEDIGQIPLQDYRLKLISIAHTLSIDSGKSVVDSILNG